MSDDDYKAIYIGDPGGEILAVKGMSLDSLEAMQPLGAAMPDGSLLVYTDDGKTQRITAHELEAPAPVPTDTQVAEVCKIGQGPACCRYLTVRETFFCEKFTGLRMAIDQRARAGTYVSVGDNCEGLHA